MLSKCPEMLCRYWLFYTTTFWKRLANQGTKKLLGKAKVWWKPECHSSEAAWQNFLSCTTPPLIPAVWTHDKCINPAQNWKPRVRSEECTGMEPSQRMANLKPRLSKRKTTDILSLNIKLQKEHKATFCTNTMLCCWNRPFYSWLIRGKKCSNEIQ